MSTDKLEGLWEEAGFPASAGFWQYLKDEDKVNGMKKKDVVLWVKEQESRQVIRRQRRPKYESSIWASAPRQQYQIDIMVYDRFEREGYKYILNCIDINSRFVAALPITTREQLDDGAMFKAFKQIMAKMGKPKRLDADNEFATQPIKNWCKQNNVFLNLSFADEAIDNKNAMIESFNKTLASRLAIRRRQGLPDWQKDLQIVIRQYNNARHSTTKAKPIDVWEGRAKNMQDIIVVDSKFKIGDLVRVLLKLKTFTKGDAQGYSDEVYRISRRDPERRNRWMIEDIDTGEEKPRGYTENSLQKIPQLVRKPEAERAKAAEKAAADAEKKKVEKRVEREKKQLEGELAQQAPARPRGRTSTTRPSARKALTTWRK